VLSIDLGFLNVERLSMNEVGWRRRRRGGGGGEEEEEEEAL
jgi:hypothetical protein